MTSPTNPAPYGYLNSGVPSDSVDKTRDDMLNLFEDKVTPLKDNTAYYEAERRPDAIGIAVPRNMQKLLAHVGYPRLYVDSMAERQELEGFRLGGADKADDDLWDWWQANNLDVEATLGHTDAFIHGRAYITVAKPDPNIDPGIDPNVPIIRVEPPTNLYAAIDPKTRKVTQAIRPIYDAEGTQVIQATLYLPLQTVIWNKEAGQWMPLPPIAHNLEIVPVIPIANRTKLSDLYGSSSITPELRSITDAAARLLMDMQATAELMAIPQRLLFGVNDQELGIDPATGLASFDAYMARILAFADPEGKAQQFLAAELRNFVEGLDALDRKAASYTGLPPQYLSVSSQNPASAEAIKSSEARLVKTVERKNKIFGGAWEEAMRIAYKVMKGGDVPPDYYRMESIWRDPSTPTYAAKGDAATKLYANGMGLITKKRGRQDMGYSIAEIAEMEKDDAKENPIGALGQIMSAPSANGSPATPRPNGTQTRTTTARADG